MEEQFAGRIAERVVGLFHPDLGVFGAVVHDYVDQHSAAGPGAGAGAVHFDGLDRSPLSARPPIAIELVEGIVRMLAGMLRPIRIMHPDAVGGFEILLLQGFEKIPHDVFFAPIAEPPAETYDNHDYRDDQYQPFALS